MTPGSPGRPGPGPAAAAARPGGARLLRLELRHNAMMWLVPVVLALFWLIYYRKTMALPPLWSPRAISLQTGVVAIFAAPVAGAAAWMGTREARRQVADLVGPPPGRGGPAAHHLGGHRCWAIAGYLVCPAWSTG